MAGTSADASIALAVVAVSLTECELAGETLAQAGAADRIERLDVDADRVVLHGRFDSERAAVVAAADMRRQGWPATTRPVGGARLVAWQRHGAPVLVSDRLSVCVPWYEGDRSALPGLVEIDPGNAFGAGSHPTTRLLLAWLTEQVEPGHRVLDVGCGSGVLAVAAAHLGAGTVVGVDIDPVAVATTSANARRNRVDDVVEATVASLDAIAGTFDMVVANISAAVLRELAPLVAERVAPGGRVGLSGISPAQVSMVGASFEPLSLDSVRREDDWVAMFLAAPDTVGRRG